MPHSSVPAQLEDLEQVEQLLDHFAELEQQFQQIREGLTHSHRLNNLGTIATIIAHEYNNILTPVISYAQLALAEPSNPELMKKAVEKALAGAERAANISASLLGFAREQDQRAAAHIPTVVEETLTCLARHPEKDGIALTLDLNDLHVAISPLNLQQVLINLVLNARKVMRRTGGKLTLTARADDCHAQIDVADTGPGIPPEILDRLFEPFVTSTDEDPILTGERRGTGLGLCICRDLIRSAGGTITVSSVPGKGATFHIILPLAANDRSASE